MSLKRYILIFAVVIFSFLITASKERVKLSGFPEWNPSKILNTEKIRRCPVLRPVFSRDFQKKAKSVICVPVVYIESSPMAECYREQPFLFGFLTLFSTTALGALAFVVHLIRNDPRFY